MPVETGHSLSHYRLIEKISEGGMGSVWKALDTRLDREVALKLQPSRVAGDPKALARFQREARAVAALSHPHILAVHDVGSDGGVHFVVMELLDGETQRQRLADGPLPLRKTVEFAYRSAMVTRGALLYRSPPRASLQHQHEPRVQARAAALGAEPVEEDVTIVHSELRPPGEPPVEAQHLVELRGRRRTLLSELT